MAPNRGLQSVPELSEPGDAPTSPALATPSERCDLPERTCLVDDCEGRAGGGIGGGGHGWCSMHYQRWRRHGDPLYEPTHLNRGQTCSIDGCEKKAKSRGWCAAHYFRWSQFGDPLHRKAGEVVDGKRICPNCGQDKPRDADHWHRNAAKPDGLAAKCKACIASDAQPYVPKAKDLRQCDLCLRMFLADKRRSRYCEDCSDQADRLWRERNRDALWVIAARRRARERAAHVEDVDRVVVFERDGWTCGICGDAIDAALPFPDPGCATVDHIVPLAKGGEHSYANCQAAHFGCNSGKKDREEVA